MELIKDRRPPALPYVPRYRCLSETKRLIHNPIRVLQQHSDKLGPNFIYYFGGAQRVLVSSDPAVIRHVLKDQHSHYHKSPIQTRHMVNYLGRGLLSDPWQAWRPKRKKLQKGLQVADLNTQAALMHTALQACLPDFERNFKAGPADLAPMICRFIFSMTARALFDISMSAQEIRQISSTVSSVQAFMVKQVFQPYLNPWFHLSGQVAKHQTLRRSGDELLLQHIKTQLQHKPLQSSAKTPTRQSLLDILCEMMDAENPEPLSLEQVLAEAMQFLVAGHETSSNTLSWTITLLDQHPQYQHMMLAELAQVCGTRSVTFSDLRQLPLTQAILDESMRLYPPFWMLDRIALTDDNIGDIRIRRGDSVMCYLYGLHRDKTCWDQPDGFIPERFLTPQSTNPTDSKHENPGQPASTKGYHHLPFGTGPRRCIGEQLARLQMIMLLQLIYQRYRITLTDPTIELAPHFTLSRRNGLMANVTPL